MLGTIDRRCSPEGRALSKPRFRIRATHGPLRNCRAIALAVTLLVATVEDAVAQTRIDTFDHLFAAAAAEAPRFALAAAIAIGDDDPVVRVAGPQNVTQSAPVDRDAAWHIGSITKSFTATLIMRLAERGLLDLDAKIERYLTPYLDDMHDDWRALTLRRLLGHTGGIPANPSILSLFRQNDTGGPHGRVAALRRFWGAPIGAHDGSFAYSNIGYVLAGLIAEEVTGQPWQALIEREITAPFGLHSVGVGPPVGAGDPWGHSWLFGTYRRVDPTSQSADNPAWMGPAGLLHASALDLIRWGRLHLRACRGDLPQLMSADSCIAMQTEGAGSYGLGWVVGTVPGTGETLVWHAGSNRKWYALLAMVPERDIVVAIATNRYEATGPDTLLRKTLAALLERD